MHKIKQQEKTINCSDLGPEVGSMSGSKSEELKMFVIIKVLENEWSHSPERHFILITFS